MAEQAGPAPAPEQADASEELCPTAAAPSCPDLPTAVPKVRRQVSPRQPSKQHGLISGPIALVLPLDAGGLIGNVAQAFYDGFNHAAKVAAVNISLEVFRTDGQVTNDLAAYQQAVRLGSSRIVGPLLRSAVDQIADLPIQELAPSLLLQQPMIGAVDPLYAYPLGVEAEIIQFARLAALSGARVRLLMEPSSLGQRIADLYAREQQAYRLAPATRDLMLNNESWLSVHEDLSRTLTNYPDELRPLLFAAGSPAFALRARARLPSALPVYTLSSAYSKDRHQTSATQIDGLRFFETAWLATPETNPVLRYDNDNIRSRPLSLQRYFAAGIDAFVLISTFEQWRAAEHWEFDGVTGRLELINGSHIRHGILVELRDGVLHPMTDLP